MAEPTPPEEEVIQTIEEEVEEFLEEFSGEPPVEEPPAEEPPVEEPVVEPPVEEPPVEEPPVEEPPIEEPPVEEPVVEPPVEEPPELDPRDAEILQLRDTIEKMSAIPLTPAPAPVEEPPAEEPPVAPTVPTPAPAVVPAPEPFKGIETREELEEITGDVDSFNKFVTNLIEHTRRAAIEHTWQSIPQVIHRQVTHQSTMKEAVDDFYKANEDLKPFRAFVGSITTQVISEKPDSTLGQLFEEVETRARKGLALRSRATEPLSDAPDPSSPAFARPKGGGRKKTPPRVAGVEEDVLDLITDD